MKVMVRAIGPVVQAPRRPNIVQAIPLYMKSDAEVFAYFRDYRDDIDKITGPTLIIPLAQEIEVGDAAAIAGIFTASVGSQRYPALLRSDLPCLWLEDSEGGHEIIRLPDKPTEIGAYIRALADAATTKQTAKSIKAEMNRHLQDNLYERSSLARMLLAELPVSKSTERLIALGCGVVFVAAILALAVVFPTPTPFQYLVFRIVLALAAAGFVAMTPGFLEVTISNWLRAGGGLAVFAVVFFYNPASLVTNSSPPAAKSAVSTTP